MACEYEIRHLNVHGHIERICCRSDYNNNVLHAFTFLSKCLAASNEILVLRCNASFQ